MSVKKENIGIEKLIKYQKSNERVSFSLEGNKIFYLNPIRYDYDRKLPNCVKFIAMCRESTPYISLSDFKVTYEGTKRWIDNQIVNNKDRILFLIMDSYGKYLGHIGLNHFDWIKKCVELDLVVRYEKNCYPGLMQAAVEAMIKWAKEELGIEEFELMVFGENEHAINFYEKCGFVKVRLIYLAYNEVEKRWEMISENSTVNPKRYLLQMKRV